MEKGRIRHMFPGGNTSEGFTAITIMYSPGEGRKNIYSERRAGCRQIHLYEEDCRRNAKQGIRC